MEESIKKFIIKDAHGGTKESGSFSVVGEVHVDIVPGYGEPYADSQYVNGILTITIHNIEGNGITEITTDSQEGDEAVNTVTIKTNANPEGVTLEVRNGSRGNGIASISEVLSPEDGGTNTHTITDTDGNEHVFHTKNGRKGDQGDSAVYDPSSPDAPDFVMANTTGQSTTKAMTQKAVTDTINALVENTDNKPTVGSDNLIKSGGVAYCLSEHISPYASVLHRGGNPTVGSSGNRYSLLFIVEVGDYIEMQSSYGAGLACGIWPNESDALVGSGSNELQIIQTDYTKQKISANAIVSGILRISTKKSSENDLSETDINDFLSSLSYCVLRNLNYNICDFIKNLSVLTSYTGFPFKRKHNAGEYVASETGNRVTIGIPVVKGMQIKANSEYGVGIAVGVFTDFNCCCQTQRDKMVQDIHMNAYTLNVISSKITADGVLCVKWQKEDGTSISASEMEDMLSSLNIKLYGEEATKIKENIIDNSDTEAIVDELNKKDLFIGTVLRRAMTASGLGNNTGKRVTMQSAVVVPYTGATIKFHLPKDYHVLFREGADVSNLNYNNFWFSDGDSTTFRTTSNFYRIGFGKHLVSNDCIDDIYAEDVQQFINTGEIKITIEDTHDIIRDNYDCEKYVKAMIRKHHIVNLYADVMFNAKEHNIPTFAHTSDTHGDAKRFSQFLDYCDYINVDAALISGDFVALNPGDYSKYIDDLADAHNTIVLPCTGNHDCRNITTAEEQRNRVVGYLMEKHDVVVNEEEDYPTYYYKDFDSQKIRIISLNMYELSRNQLDGRNFTEKQCNWFVEVLADTPTDYGVLVMFHAPEKEIVKDENYDNFFYVHQASVYYDNDLVGAPVSQIIDAFISRESKTISYNSQGTTIAVNVDFTNVVQSVEFIAYICGHTHLDLIGYVKNTSNKQLMLDVINGVGSYGVPQHLATYSNIPRGTTGVTQDAFNIYGIDREDGTVRVSRIGSNIRGDGKECKFMIIPYK